jgi:hypothetical protein
MLVLFWGPEQYEALLSNNSIVGAIRIMEPIIYDPLCCFFMSLYFLVFCEAYIFKTNLKVEG